MTCSKTIELLARQTLLVERTIESKDLFFPVDDYFHIFVVPTGNYELINMVEKDFIPFLKNQNKFIIIDPKKFVEPGLNSNTKYDKLKQYLSIRYWK